MAFVFFVTAGNFACPAQNAQFLDVPISVNGSNLGNALAGGLNNPQLSEADLNNDGIMDLVIFDRTGEVVLPFLNSGSTGMISYAYAPHLRKNFPRFTHWMLMRDYNCDDIPDIFGYSQEPGIPGVEVHRGYYTMNNGIAFQKVLFPDYFYDILWFPTQNNFPSNLFVRNIDIPDFVDVDEDGDLDVITFDQSGGYVEYYENQSNDMGFGCDSLIFRLVDNCWGRFQESGSTGEVLLSPSVDSCHNRESFIGQGFSPGQHVGSTVLALDLDGDLDKELIFGDASQNNLSMVTNGLHPDTAFMTGVDMAFPSYDEPVDLTTFPAAFSLDVNNDGMADLIAAPNERLISENYYCTHLYLNTGSNAQPVFEFQTDSFLVDQMIDFGSGSAPVFFDHNGDGLMDIVVGTRGYFPRPSGHDARLFLFENTGSLNNPSFTLVNDDYAGFSGMGMQGFNPAFGDLDNDDDLDMLVGEEQGSLIYFENSDPGNGQAVFSNVQLNYASIDVGDASSPVIVDLNNDDLPDLVIGERNGNLNYYQNTGSPENPAFTLMNDFLGEVDTRDVGFINGYSQPVFIQEGNGLVLFCGSESGSIDKFQVDQDSLLAGIFQKETGNFGNIFEGHRTRLDIMDINNDGKPEYIIGNMRGGLAMYTDPDPVAINEPVTGEKPDFTIFPNPAHNQVTIKWNHENNKNTICELFSSSGRLLLELHGNGELVIPIQGLSKGIYFIRLHNEYGTSVQKFIKAR